jgi:hypothetical protein
MTTSESTEKPKLAEPRPVQPKPGSGLTAERPAAFYGIEVARKRLSRA